VAFRMLHLALLIIACLLLQLALVSLTR